MGVTDNPDDNHPVTELIRFGLDGRPPETLRSHGTHVNTVALSPSASLVATGSVDGTVRVGPVSGEEPTVLFGHEGYVRVVAFSPDGRRLASAGNDGTIRVWQVPDPSQVPLHKRAYAELLTVLRGRTNLRAVADPQSQTGWKIERGPFLGWAKVPE